MLKRITVIAAICLMVITFACCSGDDPLKDFSNDCGVDLSGGKIVSEEDNHGGFHGDGSELLKRYSFNFTLAIYDSDANMLYLCEYDT